MWKMMQMQNPIVARLILPLGMAALFNAAFTTMSAARVDTLLQSETGSGCLDVDEQSRAGWNGFGRNVIVWPDCHGRANQRWIIERRRVLVSLHQNAYCLDIDPDTRIGASGYNVIARPDCYGRANQRWRFTRRGLLRSRAGGQRLCLDVDQSSRIGTHGRGRNVIAWPCHARANQRWHERPTYGWEGEAVVEDLFPVDPYRPMNRHGDDFDLRVLDPNEGKYEYSDLTPDQLFQLLKRWN